MADDRNQKQPDYYNPDHFFADDSFGTSLGDDYSTFFNEDDVPGAGGNQQPFADAPEQDLSSWLAETEKDQEKLFEESAAGLGQDWYGSGSGQSGASAAGQEQGGTAAGQAAGAAGTASDFWSIGDSASLSSQEPGHQSGTGGSQFGKQGTAAGSSQFGKQGAGTGGSQFDKPGGSTTGSQFGKQGSGTTGSQFGKQGTGATGSQYGKQQPGTGGSNSGGQQPASPNDGPVILGGIDGGKDKRKKKPLLPILGVLGICAAIALFAVPVVVRYIKNHQTVTNVDDPDDNDDDDTYVSYYQGYPDYGKDYNDYYMDQYAMAEASIGYAADEICVIDNDFAGSPEAPIPPETYYSMFISSNRVTMLAPLSSTYLPCGYSVVFGEPRYEREMVSGLIYPPECADQDRYFEMVREGFADVGDYEKDNYADIQYGDVRTVTINGNTVAYMEARYHDSAGNEILDTFSFEVRPFGNIFLTEYRCRQSEMNDGGQVLENLYGKLTFYTEDFDTIDAARHQFTRGRIYNKSCTHWAELDVSDEAGLEQTGSSVGSPDEMNYYFTDRKDYSKDKSIWVEYDPYSVVDSHESFRKYVDQRLESERGSEYISDVVETDRREFSFAGRDVYYYSYDKVEHYGNHPTDVKKYCFIIDTGADEELTLIITEENLSSDESFDPEAYLEKHLTMD